MPSEDELKAAGLERLGDAGPDGGPLYDDGRQEIQHVLSHREAVAIARRRLGLPRLLEDMRPDELLAEAQRLRTLADELVAQREAFRQAAWELVREAEPTDLTDNRLHQLRRQRRRLHGAARHCAAKAAR